MHGRQDRRPGVHRSCRAGQRELQIAVTSTLAEPSSARVHGHATRHDEIDASQLLRRNLIAQPCRALDGRSLSQACAEAGRIETQEAPLVGETRYGHEHDLAFTKSAQAQGPLRCIGIALNTPRALPFGKPGGASGRLLGTAKIRDATSGRKGEARHPPALQQCPDTLA
jgi:hypothetical protein